MAVNIVVPPLSESVVEATVSEWRKKIGEAVKAGEVIVVLETDKVALEVVAEADGVLASIVQAEGADVGAGALLGTLEVSGAVITPPTPVTPTTVPAPAKDSAPHATPVARRAAEALNVDLAQVSASGGKITKSDVIAAASTPMTQAPSPLINPNPRPAPQQAPIIASSARPLDPREQRVKMTRRRRTIAQRLHEAKQATAMLTTFNEIDMSAVNAVRARRKDVFKERYGVSLGYNAFFVKAVVGALKAFPILNAEIDGSDIIMKHYYDIGIAVSTDEGLVVPIIRSADTLSFAQIEAKVKEYAEQARNGTLTIESLMGGTFTITNGGVFGSLMSTPILNHPQVGILGLHAIKERPIALNGEVVIRPMMYVALSYDHRLIDGREAVQFLVKVKEYIEDPERLLIEG
ncbi:MAG: 2-oxoglutarate dehydrogenase complex dihydrolipoyllysine-residue succinyltransferase [Anaerolineae bacterium]|nr:2-oxoglutarate dehydrogenase complex dihydrolipoyllysine-residue succinyltransferase [Anaerolineae bacterium]MDW8170883.1 2-oxoglutarate dehydrogenase complex dihydrolipoyllysine-residue succinyltransferase [Anaerolineae bacterium]